MFYKHFCQHVCLYTTFMQCHGGQKRTLDPLELKLQMLVSCHVVKENKTWVLSILLSQSKSILP